MLFRSVLHVCVCMCVCSLLSYLWAFIGPAVDDLWRGVERASTEGVQERVFVVQVGQAEVRNLNNNTGGFITGLNRSEVSCLTRNFKS